MSTRRSGRNCRNIIRPGRAWPRRSSIVLEQRQLRLEAEQIVASLQLLQLLNRYGRAAIVGSVPLELIVKRDIDIHLLTGRARLRQVAALVRQRFLASGRTTALRTGVYPAAGAVKVGAEYPGRSGVWSVDVWCTSRPDRTGFVAVERLEAILTSEQRQLILQIKAYFHARGRLKDGISTRVYAAVTEKGITSLAGFMAWERTGGAGVTEP